MRLWARRCLRGLGLLAALLAGMEGLARLDDWMHQGISPLANPDRLRDLLLCESWGNRGKPHGVYRRWKLNAAGFRGPEIGDKPSPATVRIMTLGASETFGLYESPAKEYPAQLRDLLRSQGPYEVVNAAIAGVSLKSMIPYWDHWASRFRPDLVLLYPSALFYLNVALPAEGARVPIPEPAFQLRTWERLQDGYRSLPSWARSVRRDWRLRKATAGKPNEWFFAGVPTERLSAFEHDLTTLLDHIGASGARVLLMTHASSATLPIRPEDLDHLQHMRVDLYRAPPETLPAFEQAANHCIRTLATRRQLPLVDAAHVLAGRRALFADLVHFNDSGAARLASLLAEHIVPLTRGASGALQ